MSERNSRNATPLQNGARVRRLLVPAGVVVLVLMVGMFLTSLLRAPEPAWSWVLAAVAAGVALLLAGAAVRRRRERR